MLKYVIPCSSEEMAKNLVGLIKEAKENNIDEFYKI